MKDKKSIVFIEVRYRENFNYGTSTETITFNKQQKIIKTAYFYLYKENLYEKVCSRFDVIALSGTLNQLAVNWIKDAFQVPFD